MVIDIAAAAKVQLELGGKDPTYVHNDVDIQQAAASLADGANFNAGQRHASSLVLFAYYSH